MVVRLDSTVRLNNGVEMPVLGLGTAGASGKACVAAVRAALDVGYRLVDTASAYGNEREIGLAVQESRVPRNEVFITTKVANPEQGYAPTLRACEESLGRLKMDYVDLYLIHWPAPQKRIETWRAMGELLERGNARAIGVSNYMIRHLEELRDVGPTGPAVNQIELSPFLRPDDLIAHCQERGIVPEAYSPLTRGHRLKNRTIVKVATKYGRTPAQVLIRWSLQHGFVPIPKSDRTERIRENADVFDWELDPTDMRTLDALNEGRHFDWDPSDVP